MFAQKHIREFIHQKYVIDLTRDRIFRRKSFCRGKFRRRTFRRRTFRHQDISPYEHFAVTIFRHEETSPQRLHARA